MPPNPSLGLTRSGVAPRPRHLLWVVLVVAYGAAVCVGTLFPWPVAASRLAAIGPGPYVPLTYTSLSSDTRTYRSQIYLIPSRLPERWRLYRVSETNGVVRVEELPPRATP